MFNYNNRNQALKEQLIGININQKPGTQAPDQYLDYSIDPGFKGLNRLHVLTFDNNANREGHTR